MHRAVYSTSRTLIVPAASAESNYETHKTIRHRSIRRHYTGHFQPEGVVDMSKIKCPLCDGEVHVAVDTQMMDEQTLKLVIEYQGDLLHAETVWGMVKDFEILMKTSAKDQGEKVNVWVRNITNADHKLTVEFVVTTVRNK